MSPQLCIVFVVQPGELALKGVLLAASLRRNGGLDNVDLVAAVPDPALWGALPSEVEKLLQLLQVRIVVIGSPFGTDYPIGNKLAAIGVPTLAPVTLFLDSDILCLSPIDINALLTTGIKAKPADLNTFSGDASQWQSAYGVAGLDAPEIPVISTVSKEVMPPYFNAGVIAVCDGMRFSSTWIDVARKIDACPSVTNKRPWLDQIALPVAAAVLGFSFECLHEGFNYPAHLQPISHSHVPYLCHYHSPDVIAKEATLSRLVVDLVKKYPGLKTLLEDFSEWQPILKRGQCEASALRSIRHLPSFRRRSISDEKIARDFLITGLPRSGTSMLCNLLHQGKDVVVVNEPQEVFAALQHDERCLPLARFYRELRTKVLLQQGIQNKLDDKGRVIEDTKTKDSRQLYYPTVDSPQFFLGTKNPLAYLTRLRMLCDAFPDMPKIVTVRDPFHLINSWKASFAHLRDIDLTTIPFTDTADELLDGMQRKYLQAVRRETFLPARRALYLRYLAALIHRDKHRVLVVRYEDLASFPQRELKRVTDYLGMQALDRRIFSTVRPPTATPCDDGQDRLAINALCGEFMQTWGYVPRVG